MRHLSLGVLGKQVFVLLTVTSDDGRNNIHRCVPVKIDTEEAHHTGEVLSQRGGM